MKKLLTVLALVLGMGIAAQARGNYIHEVSALPAAAQTTLKNNFKAKVSVIKTETTFGRVDQYEVILTDGTEVTFDRQGNWKDIETAINKSVPKSMVPEEIRKYVSKVQPGTKIVGIEKESRGYEVELSNGVEMRFDRQCNFVKYE